MRAGRDDPRTFVAIVLAAVLLVGVCERARAATTVPVPVARAVPEPWRRARGWIERWWSSLAFLTGLITAYALPVIVTE